MVEKGWTRNMKKCVSYDKLSKKEKKRINAQTRRTFNDFGCFSPITKIVPDKKEEKRRGSCREKQFYISEMCF